MVTVDEARRIVRRYLDDLEGEVPLAVVHEEEFADGWAFVFNSRRYLETRRREDCLLGPGPLVVDRDTGELAAWGSAYSVERAVAEYAEPRRRRREGWPVGLDGRLRTLLELVRDGGGRRTERYLRGLMSVRHPPREGRGVGDELTELRRRRLVEPAADTADGEPRWRITAAGQAELRRG
jgi:immunity protein 35 of polymorphic toxin system